MTTTTTVLMVLLLCVASATAALQHTWTVTMKPGTPELDMLTRANSVARELHLQNLGPVSPLLKNVFILAGNPPAGRVHAGALAAAQGRQEGVVLDIVKQVSRWRYTRTPPLGGRKRPILGPQHPPVVKGKTRDGQDIYEPSDPLWGHQWYMHGVPGISLEPGTVWARGTNGHGVRIGIVDDGLDWRHPDFSGHYLADSSYDINDGDTDPTPGIYDDHGTAAAGVAAAANNSFCISGVAPGAGVAGIRLLARDVTDADEARALAYGNLDIYSCSWGPADDGQRLEGPGPLLTDTLEAGAAQGRGGLGSIFVWASGNGRGNGDSCNYDGYANGRYTVPIGAMNAVGKQAWYSEGCAALIGVMPSSGVGESVISTGLMVGGTRPTCNTMFGGTSAAAPMAAGLVALMLQVKPTLTWRDVQRVLVHCATPVDTTDPSWARNGAGLMSSTKYGFGRFDVRTCVDLAAVQGASPAAITRSTGKMPAPWNGAVIGDAKNPASIGFTLPSPAIGHIEYVQVCVAINHPDRGRLTIGLTSPSGMTSTLAEPHEDHHTDYPTTGWCFGTRQFWDEPSGPGTWTLRVSAAPRPAAAGPQQQVGRVRWYQVTVYGG